jgi:MFS family permease
VTAPSSEPSAPHRPILKIVFFTLFLDLVGFSLIFPLFPGMLEFYRETSPPGGLFSWFHGVLSQASDSTGATDAGWGVLVLFGGILGSLYSLLQFAFSPVLGALSDRYGRRPVLLASLSLMLGSYVLWFFAGRFELLVIARLLGGVASANISIASAIVADSTPRDQRARGMAVVGIAFGLGFVLGPAIGGLCALADLTALAPELAAWGVNPFSVPALVAAVLSVANLLLVWTSLPETRPARLDGPSVDRTLNPLRIFHASEFPGVARANGAYFLFIFAFSGVEFSLTFMAADYFGYGPGRNAAMLLFVGIVLALVQGFYVRRVGDRIGPRTMALHGFATMIPALALIGLAGPWDSQPLLYAGLFLSALGMGQTIPCLTSLVTLYANDDSQGRVNGLFRSAGALGRAGGPLFASTLYWRLGAPSTYTATLVLMAVAGLIALGLPRVAGSKSVE